MKYKILVVDDDKELVKMLCSYFNMKQYETITATDGMETSLDKGTQRKTTENELPSLTQCTA